MKILRRMSFFLLSFSFSLFSYAEFKLKAQCFGKDMSNFVLPQYIQRSQGKDGTCYAMGETPMYEAARYRSTGKLKPFSIYPFVAGEIMGKEGEKEGDVYIRQRDRLHRVLGGWQYFDGGWGADRDALLLDATSKEALELRKSVQELNLLGTRIGREALGEMSSIPGYRSVLQVLGVFAQDDTFDSKNVISAYSKVVDVIEKYKKKLLEQESSVQTQMKCADPSYDQKKFYQKSEFVGATPSKSCDVQDLLDKLLSTMCFGALPAVSLNVAKAPRLQSYHRDANQWIPNALSGPGGHYLNIAGFDRNEEGELEILFFNSHYDQPFWKMPAADACDAFMNVKTVQNLEPINRYGDVPSEKKASESWSAEKLSSDASDEAVKAEKLHLKLLKEGKYLRTFHGSFDPTPFLGPFLSFHPESEGKKPSVVMDPPVYLPQHNSL